MMHSILLVSNSPQLRQSITMDLYSGGYRISDATNGQEALDKMEKQDAPDLLLISSPLPDMDGIQLARQFRKLSAYQFLPIVMMSSNRSQSLEAEGLAAGVTGWLNLPVTPEQLQTVINRLLT
jgi:two-component system, chemotaxis family, chemotaxis protein CheY